MIYCVWYPSGGFGHFVSGIMNLYGKNFFRPNKSSIEFDANGNAHALDLVAPKYQNSYNNYNFNFDPEFNYSVLIDNGINNESLDFLDDFTNARVIKICYSRYTWPVVARTMIDKAMNSSLEKEIPVYFVNHTVAPDWAVREKYFLFLRDHKLAHQWAPSSTTENLLIDQLFNYYTFCQQLNSMGIEVENFYNVWQQWYRVNQIYIAPVIQAKSVIQDLKQNQLRTLDDFDTLWSQAVLYYFLFLEFGVEVPHNDYADFFDNTGQIKEWLTL
jgi:hypothetical protein